MTLSDGVLYGTTESGGSSDHGTVFKVNTDGSGYTLLKNLAGRSSGSGVSARLTSSSGSVLYGTTAYGGSSDQGTVFRLNTDGTGYTLLEEYIAAYDPITGSFTNSDGVGPGRLTLSDDSVPAGSGP